MKDDSVMLTWGGDDYLVDSRFLSWLRGTRLFCSLFMYHLKKEGHV